MKCLYRNSNTICTFECRIPDWAKSDLKKMKYIREVNYKIKALSPLVRLKTGFLLADIFDRFSQKIDGTLEPKTRTLWVYSVHSSTMKLLFNGLGLPSVCASIIMLCAKRKYEVDKEIIQCFCSFLF